MKSIVINFIVYFQVSVQSIQADHNITLPSFYAANELTFDADGVAIITYNTTETSTWDISCWPKEVSYWISIVTNCIICMYMHKLF